jgi:hypothetical protein
MEHDADINSAEPTTLIKKIICTRQAVIEPLKR